MELYDKKYVYFDWDDKLEGKKGFFSDNIKDLKRNVKDNRTQWYGVICHNVNTGTNFPFGFIDDSGSSHCFRFCYYDPYYEFRKAYLEGKQLQFKDDDKWVDVRGEPLFNGDEYRIKSNMWYIVLDDCGLSRTNLKRDDVMFEGTEEECIQWMEKYKKFEKILLAHRQGKTIQYKENDKWVDWMLNEFPRGGAFIAWEEWRIKDEPAELVPFDTVHELIDTWYKEHPTSSDTSNTMPLIWVKSKAIKCIYLIDGYDYEDNDVGIDTSWVALGDLFDDYTFINGSIIGKVKE